MIIRKKWERQEGETSKAYEAFVVFRDLGTGRTLAAVSEKLGKSYDLIRRWNKNFKWQERADAWDNMLSDKAAKKVSEDYARMLEFQINVGKMLQTKGAKSIQQMDFDNAPLASLPSIVSMINSGAKLERSARDLNAEKFQKQELTINIIPRQKDIKGEDVIEF